MHLSLRKVTSQDLHILYEWINDKTVRKNSINNKKISIEEHTRWLKEKLKSKNNFIYMFKLNSIPVGVTRIEKKKNYGYLSYLISKQFRNKGLGHIMLIKFIKKIYNRFPKLKINALVIKKNIASKKIFNKIGFKVYKIKKKIIHFQLNRTDFKK